MSLKKQRDLFCKAMLFAALCFNRATPGFSQSAKPSQTYPANLKYSFSNVVWWSDEDLRKLLKKRIPDLGDEIATTPAALANVRNVLKSLLKEKGIDAQIQSEEPSTFALTAKRVMEMPPPSVVFSVLSPKVMLDKVVVSQAPNHLAERLQQQLSSIENQPFSRIRDWKIHVDTKQELYAQGYLTGDVHIMNDAPRREGDRVLVDLLITVDSGPQYHLAAITVDGGPLLKGVNLSSSPLIEQNVGEVAAAPSLGRLEVELRALYWQHGYADVEIHERSELDAQHALVSYHFNVIAGPLYHLSSITIHNLNADDEARARSLLYFRSGDVFDLVAVTTMSRNLDSDPSLKNYGFTYTAVKDASTGSADLTLNFFRQGSGATVTTR